MLVLTISSLALASFILFVRAPDSPGPLSQSWAQYSPYFPVNPYKPPPHGCAVTQLADPNITQLQRHGARFPTALASVPIRAALSKLQSVPTVDSNLAFLANFTYDLGTDDLVPLGTRQSQESGSTQYERYSHLVSSDNLPFVRASSSERVVQSAIDWNTVGFSDASKRRFMPTLSVILSEAANDTLNDSMCPSASSSDAQTAQWLSIYAAPITFRLNSQAPGAELDETDIFNLLSLCPFHTVATEELSPFCDLFTAEEFAAFDYSGDLNKYYGTGYGQPLGRVQGVGYVNELLARLTRTSVRDHTQTNRTLDSSPDTFPLNRTIYADFSHDNQMIAIYAALGLFNIPEPLNPTGSNEDDGWKVSRMTPFSARMVVEKLECGSEEFVRILANDAVQPLTFCGAGGDGMCRLSEFVESQAYARNDGMGDFEKCSA
ncbi:histidine phosphatase superfamily [Infundibulicybe gibba]|nr:histidine phosphatase superfamily [Infundibulicybe gibba]